MKWLCTDADVWMTENFLFEIGFQPCADHFHTLVTVIDEDGDSTIYRGSIPYKTPTAAIREAMDMERGAHFTGEDYTHVSAN